MRGFVGLAPQPLVALFRYDAVVWLNGFTGHPYPISLKHYRLSKDHRVGDRSRVIELMAFRTGRETL